MSGDPIEGLADDLAAQREFVAERDPVYARLLDVIAPLIEGEIAERLREVWADREFGAWYERPLMLLTSIREDVLYRGPTHPLWAALGDPKPAIDPITESAVLAMLAEPRVIASLRSRFVQTNDTARAIAWVWPAALGGDGRAVALYDVGASAGLNLVADRLPLSWEREDGEPLALDPLPPIVTRAGFDVRPLDMGDPDQARWLRALVWPSQRERASRLEAAIAAFSELGESGAAPSVEAASAADIPDRLPSLGPDGPRGLAYQTIVRDYIAEPELRRYEAGMRDWLTRSAPGSAAWAELELDGRRRSSMPVVIRVRVATGDGQLLTAELARCEPHPRTLEVDDAAVTELTSALRG